MQDLVDGYRELNNLAEQAPLYVMQTASDYARALGATQFPEPRTVAADGGESQARACSDGFAILLRAN